MIPLAIFTPVTAAGAAVAAVGVPLLIHLLFRKRYQIVPWAAVRFLVAAERRHRRRIDQWLLLLLRTLALLLPLFAMLAVSESAEQLWQTIRPGALETIPNTPRTHHVIVIDGTLSMVARTDDGRTRFGHALDRAEAFVRNAPAGDGFTLIYLAGTSQAVIPRPSNDPEKVATEIRNLKPTHATGDIAAALLDAADAVAESPRTAYPRRQVTVFSDLQRASWDRALPAEEKTGGADEKVRQAWKRIVEEGKADVVVVDVARLDVENLAITDVALADPLPLTDAPAVVTATVQNFGKTERRRVHVELLLGRPSASGADAMARVDDIKPIDTLPPGGRTQVTFVLNGPNRFRDRGVHVLQAGLVKDDFFPGDDLPADDTRSMAVEVRDGLHVALIDGRPSADPDRRGSSHVSWALHPPGLPLTETPARLFRPGQRPPELPDDRWVLSPAQATDPTLGDLTGADCVFLLDVPNPSAELVAKLEAHLRRGGGLIIGLGPNAAASRDAYNRLLFNDAKGILPGRLGDVVAVDPLFTPGFQLAADDESFRRLPLAAFRSDQDRTGLTSATFHGYLTLDAPPDGRARRILSFGPALDLPAGWVHRGLLFGLGYPIGPPAPAVVEWPRYRGRVVVYTSTFHPDAEWTEWAKVPSYLPFVHQLLRFAAANPDRHTVRVGEPLEEYFPAAIDDRTAGLSGPEGLNATLPLIVQDEALLARFTDTTLSGLYRLGVGGSRDRVFAVNVPEMSPTGGSESHLMQVDKSRLKASGPVQVVNEPSEVKPGGEEGESVVITKPRPRGPGIARAAMVLALLVLIAELFVAWRFGPSCAPGAGAVRRPERRRWLWALGTVAAVVPLVVAAFALFTLAHAETTGRLFGFVPDAWRQRFESEIGVPASAPGEGTSLRLEWFTAFHRIGSLVRVGIPDRVGAIDTWLRLGLAVACGVFVAVVYWMERRAAGGARRLVLPALLRASSFGLALFVILPQLQIAFDREGWPEIVILLDTSASMATEDEMKDPAVRAKADELANTVGLPRAERIEKARADGQPAPQRPNRLELAQATITRPQADWLDKLVSEKKVKVSVYAIDRTTGRVSGIYETAEIAGGRKDIWKLQPIGDASYLGDGVQAVLRDYRGGSLAGVIYFTDGVTTAGSDLPTAARESSRAGVPLYIVGTGDAWEAPDLALSDLQVEDVVTRGDNLVFTARLTACGQVPPEPVTVILCEKRDNPADEPQQAGQPGVLAQATVTPDPSGNPVTVRLSYTPTTVGEKVFVLKVPPVPEELNTANNRLERSILVTEARRIRVLYIEGRPRYDFRFAKVLLERESGRAAENKGVEVRVVLLGASSGWPETDRSALAAFPTRDQLFEYDVVVLGDFDPALMERHFANETDPRTRTKHALRDLADFVRVRGGGMLVLAGEQAGPAGFVETPLADVLPVVPTEGRPKVTSEDRPLTEGYRPRLTPAGQRHPLFRLRPDEAESAQVWNRLPPLYWYASGYKRKPAAEVLAVHPERTAEATGPTGRPENHPLVLQQFVGGGRVIFLGFDDTWRWRFRNDEEHFNRFWLQSMRVLARARVGRIELRTDKQTPYREGERMVITARFPDDAPPPPDGQVVRVRWTRSPLTGPGGMVGIGETGDDMLTLTRPKVSDANRKPDDARTFQHVLTRTPAGEYRFVLIEPEVEGNRPRAEAKVYPPPDERTRVDLNKPDLIAAATISNGGFYTLADADQVLDDLKNLERVPLNQPCPPLTIWNQPLTYGLLLLLLMAEWILRKRERLL